MVDLSGSLCSMMLVSQMVIPLTCCRIQGSNHFEAPFAAIFWLRTFNSFAPARAEPLGFIDGVSRMMVMGLGMVTVG